MNPITIDSGYMGHPGCAATYLLPAGDRAAFIETNTTYAVPGMLRALADAGFQPEQVELIIITHVHLDHAGGASALMRACPNATLLAHPRAARHAIDPTKLVASASVVYGEARFKELYGQIDPIPADRVRIMEDGESLRLGERELEFIYTRGHANHHFVIHDSVSRGVFTGDAFGIAYPHLQKNGLFAFPSTSPTDFDPQAAKESIERIVATGAQRVYPTHFGERTDVRAFADALLKELDAYEGVLKEATESDLEGDALGAFCGARIRAFFERALAEHGLSEDAHARELLEVDIDLNGQGVAFAAGRLRKAG